MTLEVQTIKLIEALEKIQELCKPGQEIYHSQCIDIMCDCYNIAKNAVEAKQND